MRPGKIQGATSRLGAPANWHKELLGECDSLEIRKYGDLMASNWFPTPEELALLNMGQPVTLTVWGSAHPPVSLNVTPAPVPVNVTYDPARAR